MMKTEPFTHLDAEGRARMVDVSLKPVSRRHARAEGVIRMRRSTLAAIERQEVDKGDVVTVARVAAIAGAKRTAELVPLCHPLSLEAIDVQVALEPDIPGLRLAVETSVEARTGAEMEALCGVAAGLLAVYDMCKALDRGMEVGPLRLVSKKGGASGDWPGDAMNGEYA